MGQVMSVTARFPPLHDWAVYCEEARRPALLSARHRRFVTDILVEDKVIFAGELHQSLP